MAQNSINRREVLKGVAGAGTAVLGGAVATGSAAAQQGGGVGFIGDLPNGVHWAVGREGTVFTLGNSVNRTASLNRGCGGGAQLEHVGYNMGVGAFLYVLPQHGQRLQGGTYVIDSVRYPCQESEAAGQTHDWARITFSPVQE